MNDRDPTDSTVVRLEGPLASLKGRSWFESSVLVFDIDFEHDQELLYIAFKPVFNSIRFGVCGFEYVLGARGAEVTVSCDGILKSETKSEEIPVDISQRALKKKTKVMNLGVPESVGLEIGFNAEDALELEDTLKFQMSTSSMKVIWSPPVLKWDILKPKNVDPIRDYILGAVDLRCSARFPERIVGEVFVTPSCVTVYRSDGGPISPAGGFLFKALLEKRRKTRLGRVGSNDCPGIRDTQRFKFSGKRDPES